ncbi:alkaline phosphatase family protein [Robertkochia aurantiaca]|uniref:alkaline phosphatase family protein n=1 Tax=Robertkochia aurantiaca TaxID=2873700 RepID=UPI001CC94E1C|nr:nucleotide pyrophosphatase/phosphodiesterase family protein [Robertkochia sp. 3YJGBD-33]
MKKTVVIDVVGLCDKLIGEHTPFIEAFRGRNRSCKIRPVIPAVTCTAQATYLTGEWPSTHGVVGNGWFFKDEQEVRFWRQSNRLVQAPKIWDVMKKEDPAFTCANLFWWYNMYSGADYSVTPRPNYLADGRKIPDVYSQPAELRDELQQRLGTFPLFHFWGPKTSIKSSKWIAEASKYTEEKYDPTLTLIYLPHLDYNLQRFGTHDAKIAADLAEIDAVVKDLVTFYESRGAGIVLLSEYGISDADHPVHVNRVLREAGYLAIRRERGLELLDAGASEAFAVADHQICHVYVKDLRKIDKVKALLSGIQGVGSILDKNEQKELHLDHERSGDLVLLADDGSWFTYYYWHENEKAPDFARTVDIHKKPGYDPVEMFTDPEKPLMTLRVLWKLLAKKMGFRVLMDLIPLDAGLIKGSHGIVPESNEEYPVFITNSDFELPEETDATGVFELIKQHLTTTSDEIVI